jgi:uncharacterized protein (UPF0276 family)
LSQTVPVLLERDFNLPEWKELRAELNHLRHLKNHPSVETH